MILVNLVLHFLLPLNIFIDLSIVKCVIVKCVILYLLHDIRIESGSFLVSKGTTADQIPFFGIQIRGNVKFSFSKQKKKAPLVSSQIKSDLYGKGSIYSCK